MKYMKESFSNMVPYSSKLITDGIILNANESPYMPPKKVVKEINKLSKGILYNRYPDMDEVELNSAIAKKYNIKPEEVTVGVGSDELLDVVFRATLNKGDIVLGFTPSFSMYKVFTELVEAKYIPILGDLNLLFSIDDMVNKIKEYNPKLVIICSPNNPTGQYFKKDDVKRVIESTKSLILLDLAYIDFANEDYVNIALNYDNVISFKTFSKAYALPSIRVGYAISKKDNIDMINAIKAPYSVSTFSQLAAKIAIENGDLYKEQVDLIKSERERLYKELKSLNFDIYPSQANFLFIKMDKKYYEALLNNKIYIRKFSDNEYRITVGSKKENDLLLEVMKNA